MVNVQCFKRWQWYNRTGHWGTTSALSSFQPFLSKDPGVSLLKCAPDGAFPQSLLVAAHGPQWNRAPESNQSGWHSLIPWWLFPHPLPLPLLSISQSLPSLLIIEYAIHSLLFGFLCFIKVHLIIRVVPKHST